MPDTIVGLSVLQPIWIPGLFRLWCVGQKDSGARNQCHLFIKEKQSVGLPDSVPNYPPGCNAVWKFTRIQPAALECEPSVNWISWNFHNCALWRTEYVEMTTIEPEDAWRQERTREDCGSAIHYDLNFIKDLDRPKFLAELRQRGILL